MDPPTGPTVDLPSAPSSPNPALAPHEGSVHWGVVGDHSGVQTPADSPEARNSVINLAPPALPPRRSPTVILQVPPPKRAGLLSPSLVHGVSALIDQIPTAQETLRRPVIYQPERKIPIVSTDIYPPWYHFLWEVFLPIQG